jgi:hypothetical protein
MLVGTILAWGAFGGVTANTSPDSAGPVGFALFFVTLYVALVGTFALIGLVLRKLLMRSELPTKQVWISFRQSFSFALLIVVALFLQSKSLLYWWNVLFLVIALTFVEVAVLLLQKNRDA